MEKNKQLSSLILWAKKWLLPNTDISTTIELTKVLITSETIDNRLTLIVYVDDINTHKYVLNDVNKWVHIF